MGLVNNVLLIDSRTMQSVQILIDSKDRTSSSVSTSDFVIQLDQQITDIKQIQLDMAILPVTFYNIMTGSNDVLTFVENSTTKTATLSAACYTATGLATEIQSKLNVASGGYNTFTVTYSSSTMKVRSESIIDMLVYDCCEQ